MIEAARQQVAQAVNAGLVTLYWHVGKRIRQEVLGEERAAYGEQIVTALSDTIDRRVWPRVYPHETSST